MEFTVGPANCLSLFLSCSCEDGDGQYRFCGVQCHIRSQLKMEHINQDFERDLLPPSHSFPCFPASSLPSAARYSHLMRMVDRGEKVWIGLETTAVLLLHTPGSDKTQEMKVAHWVLCSSRLSDSFDMKIYGSKQMCYRGEPCYSTFEI